MSTRAITTAAAWRVLLLPFCYLCTQSPAHGCFFSVQQDSSCDLWFRFISTTVKLCLDLLLFFFVVVVVDISLLKSNHFIRKKWAVVIFTDMNNGTKILAVFYNLYDCKNISDFDNYELVHRQNYFTLLFPELLQIGVVHIIGTCVINVHVHIPRHKNWLFFELLEISEWA